MEKGLKNSTIAYCLVGFGFIFSLGIGKVALFDLDELYFAEITREMMLTGHYGQVTFNFEPLYEKPPLFFWLQAASMHLWGINEIGARFPNLVCSFLTLITVYYIGKTYKGKWFGFCWMCLHATAFLPHFYFKSAIIDPFFNYFLLLAIYCLSRAATLPTTQKSLYAAAGLWIGCALLAKGPMGAIIPLATLLLSYTWFKGVVVRLKQLIITMLVATITLSFWLIPEIYSNGFLFIKKFWAYHWLLYHQPVDAHHQPWYYHYIVLFLGCFPNTFFAMLLLNQKRWIRNNYFAANMQALWAVVLLIFTLVGTKIVHYSSMAYFPITFFAADWFYEWMYNREKSAIHRWIAWLFLVVGMAIGICLSMIPWLMLHKPLWISIIKNQQVGAALDLPVIWSYWDSLPGLIYIIGAGLAFRYLLQSRLIPFMSVSMSINSFSLALFLISIAPKVEYYTQKEMVDFCKACKGKDVYITTIGFKSAAPLFYSNQPKNFKKREMAWLLEGPIDKPCFFIVYKSDAALLDHYKDITYLKGSGCFAFYQRLPLSIQDNI